jgi:ABC-2 type transport system permease protein
MTNNPISDLSYRHYDGPLNTPVARWWSIAKMTMKLATSKRAFWGWSIFSAWWYAILLIVFWFFDNVIEANAKGAGAALLKQIVWKDQFVNAYSFSQMILMVLTLMVGVGSIANDNRSNALMIYLSKPCTKLDYVVGKWVGVFVPITLVSLVPMIVFYLFGMLSYQNYGFWTASPWLFLKLILVAGVSGAVHASLSLGISSMFNQGRVAGATYAGLYFLTNIFTKTIQFFYVISSRGENGAPNSALTNPFYFSIDGIQIGLSKIIIGTNGTPLFPGMNGGGPRRGGGGPPPVMIIGAPSAPLMLTIFFAVVLGGFLIAYSRIRAVEVVG